TGRERVYGWVAAAPARPHLVPRALIRIFVRAEPDEAGAVPEAIALELVVAHLDDELRANRVPVQLLAARPSALAARDPLVADEARLDELRQALLKFPPHGRREPGRVADEVELPRLVVEPQQDGRDPAFRLLAPAEADDHAIGRLVRLDLDDAVARP